jgi:hypothetical protein
MSALPPSPHSLHVVLAPPSERMSAQETLTSVWKWWMMPRPAAAAPVLRRFLSLTVALDMCLDACWYPLKL